VDDCSDADNFVGIWTGQQLHHGRFYTCPAGAGSHRCPAQLCSGTQSCVACKIILRLIDTKKSGMKTYSIAAIILISIGIAALAYQGISYTSREKIVDIGPIQMTAERTRTLPLSPIVGGFALVGGIAWLAIDKRNI